MVKRSAVNSDGDKWSSAIRLRTKPSPQVTATAVARKMSRGFMLGCVPSPSLRGALATKQSSPSLRPWIASQELAMTKIDSCPVRLHPLGAAADRGDAGARYFDEAERTHQIDELVDLGGIAGDLEHETFGGGVDHPGAKRLGEAQRLDAVLAGRAQFHHRQLALDRAPGQRHVDHAVHRNHAVELVLDLLDHHRRAGGDDGDARDVLLVLGLRNRETLDVVAAP